jgi:hypothetical protein
VRLLDAEEPDNRVADELLHDAAVLLERHAHDLVEATEPQPHVLDVERLRSGGRADDVGEERRDCPALLEGCRDRNWCSTRGTEARVAPG